MESVNEISGYLSPHSDEMNTAMDYNDNVDEGDSADETISQKEKIKKSLKQTKVEAKLASASKPKSVFRYKYIPMRLSAEERKLLQVLESALEVCEYTDVVDVTFSHTKKSKLSRIIESLVDVLSIACGLIVSSNLSKGEGIVADRSLNDNVPLFTDLFEIGRRYKVMNPSKLRGSYGKLMYLLMDSESYHVKQDLRINFVKPILT
eukprot:gene42612-52067_t